jgi:hypothetical protein
MSTHFEYGEGEEEAEAQGPWGHGRMLSPAPPASLTNSLIFFYCNIAINTAASALTLILMLFMYKRNALKFNLFIKCVLLLTTYQFMYDASLALGYECGPTSSGARRYCTSLWMIGWTFGGFGAALWSLIILIVAARTIISKTEPTKGQQYIVFALAHLFMIAWAVPYARGGLVFYREPSYFTSLLVAYNDTRLAIVFITIFVMVYLYFKVVSYSNFGPVQHLFRKLVFYPIIQCVTRLGACAYQFKYHSTIDEYPARPDSLQRYLLYLYVLFTPLAGGLSFLVFLNMKDEAKKYLRLLLCSPSACLCICDSESASTKEDGNRTGGSDIDGAHGQNSKKITSAKRKSKRVSAKIMKSIKHINLGDDDLIVVTSDGADASPDREPSSADMEYSYGDEYVDDDEFEEDDAASASAGVSKPTVTEGDTSAMEGRTSSNRFFFMDEGDLLREIIASGGGSGGGKEGLGRAGSSASDSADSNQIELGTLGTSAGTAAVKATLTENPMHGGL